MQNQLAKLSSSLEADKALDQMLSEARNGFSAGKISKTELLSWLILYFSKNSFTACLEDIRNTHFDQIVYLESLLKEVKRALSAGEKEQNVSNLVLSLRSPQGPSSGRPSNADLAKPETHLPGGKK